MRANVLTLPGAAMSRPFLVRELLLSYRTRRLDADADAEPFNRSIASPRDAAAIAAALETSPGIRLDAEPVEVFAVLLLNGKHRVIGYHVVSRGTLDASFAYPRDVFRPAIAAPCTAVVLIHNHPSGDPTPSPDDLTVTSRLADAGRIIGIDVLDHVIIGEAGRYTSLRERGQFGGAA